ncbi:LGFP repeat-containing protein [Streptomyces coeruleoprunus]|uniref:LGFP repeat-containing protein n=1 Tax=Streptomyces coeruleoprunus TaxID=285563 RepID=A0ABV9X7Y0_9ACTN
MHGDIRVHCLYWTPRTGAHEVHGVIRDLWAGMGWERGFLGCPTYGGLPHGNGRRSRFRHGEVTRDAKRGAEARRGVLFEDH